MLGQSESSPLGSSLAACAGRWRRLSSCRGSACMPSYAQNQAISALAAREASLAKGASMSRRIGIPVRVERDARGQLLAFTWRGGVYRVRVLSVWRLATRWWDYERAADRTYYRVETADHQIFELYCDDAQGGVWVLDIVQD
jgi:hypothetical protein